MLRIVALAALELLLLPSTHCFGIFGNVTEPYLLNTTAVFPGDKEIVWVRFL